MDNIRKLFLCCYPTVKEKENEFKDFFDNVSESSINSISKKKVDSNMNKQTDKDLILNNLNKNKSTYYNEDKENYNFNRDNNNNNEILSKEDKLLVKLKDSNQSIPKKTSFLKINPKNSDKRSSFFSKNNSFVNSNSAAKKVNPSLLSNEEVLQSTFKFDDEDDVTKKQNFSSSGEKPNHNSSKKQISNDYLIIQEMANDRNSEEYESSSILTDIDVQQNHKLELEDIEGNFLSNKKVVICAAGLEATQSHRKSGKTVFGISREHFIKNTKTNYLVLPNIKEIDYEIYLKEFNNSSNVLFVIVFNKYIKSYFIKPYTCITDKVYMFYKLFKDNEIILNSIISLGEYIVSIVVNSDLSLKVQVLNKSKILNEYNFKPTKEIPIRIGRSRINEISIHSSSFSKTQCNLYFNDSLKKWFIQDGYDDSRSKNGTWVYLNRDMEILEDIFIKIQDCFFAIHICK